MGLQRKIKQYTAYRRYYFVYITQSSEDFLKIVLCIPNTAGGTTMDEVGGHDSISNVLAMKWLRSKLNYLSFRLIVAYDNGNNT